MANYLLQVSLLMAVFYLPFVLWFRNETFFKYNRAYLVFTMIFAAMAPFAPRWLDPAQLQETMVFLDPVTISSTVAMQEIVLDDISVSSSLSFVDIAAGIYLVVVVFMLLRMLVEISGILKIAFTGARERINGHVVVVSDDVKAPFSFFHWIFLPQDIRNDRSKFYPVFRHEVMHVRAMHSLDIVLVEVLCALFWINPFVYMYRRSLKALHEFEADAIVDEDERIEYTQLLISQSQSGLRLALTNQFFQSQLKSRIMMMMKQRSSAINKWKYLLAAPIFICSLVLFSFKAPEITGVNGTKSNTEALKMGEVDHMPIFPGCSSSEAKQQCSNKKLIEFVAGNLKYPDEARKNGVEGKVILSFVVEADGSVSKVETVRGIGGGCDEEAERVVKSMNDLAGKWSPATKDGKAVSVEMKLPIIFALPDDTHEGSGDVFEKVEEMPRFPGCENMPKGEERQMCSQKELFTYIIENMRYPKDAKEKNIEGRVIAQFVVEPNGKISSIQVVKGMYPSCDAEVVRILEGMNSLEENWIPGKNKGEAVRTKFTIPVQFKL